MPLPSNRDLNELRAALERWLAGVLPAGSDPEVSGLDARESLRKLCRQACLSKGAVQRSRIQHFVDNQRISLNMISDKDTAGAQSY